MEDKKISAQIAGRYRTEYVRLAQLGQTPEQLADRQSLDARALSLAMKREVTTEELLGAINELAKTSSAGHRPAMAAWREEGKRLTQNVLSFLNARILDVGDQSPETIAIRKLSDHLYTGIQGKNPWIGGVTVIGVNRLDLNGFNQGEEILINLDRLLATHRKGWGHDPGDTLQFGPNPFLSKPTKATYSEIDTPVVYHPEENTASAGVEEDGRPIVDAEKKEEKKNNKK